MSLYRNLRLWTWRRWLCAFLAVGTQVFGYLVLSERVKTEYYSTLDHRVLTFLGMIVISCFFTAAWAILPNRDDWWYYKNSE